MNMGRFFMGTIGPGVTTRRFLFVTTAFNPQGDWGQAYMLAHPRNPNAELVCDFHGKVLSGGIFFYAINVTNRGPFGTDFDIDF
jgi:hypothetical protein